MKWRKVTDIKEQTKIYQQRTTLKRIDIAAEISRAKIDILREWEARSRKEVAAARDQSRLALRNSLPKFLDRLAETLSAEKSKNELVENTDAAKEHAEDRANLPEYTIGEVIHEYHILRKVITEALQAKDLYDLESQIVINEFVERSIRDAADRFINIETDRQKKQAIAIEEAKVAAEQANQTKSTFLANMSHEIRTPLGAIMGFVNLLRDNGIDQEGSTEYLNIIDRNSHQLLRIFDDILDLTKVEAGKMLMERSEFSLVEFLADFSSLAGIKTREKEIIFEFKAESLLPEFIVLDSTRLRQILLNVVGNAIKFTEKGRVELTVKYVDKYLEFTVTDTGRGISDQQRIHLFRAFSQADSSATREFGGTGLGLVLTKRLSEAMGGEFELTRSELGKGSTFTVCLPVHVPPEVKLLPLKSVEVKAIETSLDRNSALLNGQEILLIEDSPDNQFLVQQILKKTGAKITVANDGAVGVEMALARRYNVILCDIQMPVMDGHEAVRTLRGKGYTGPIVALTAHAMKEEREKAIKSGFSHFLSKPVDKKSLMDVLVSLHSPLNLRL